MNFIFPQYRKLRNDRSYYKITDPSNLLEIQRTDSRWTQHLLAAKILPERNLIMDLLENTHMQYVIIEEKEFEEFRKYCNENLKRF